jgi:hypothetical protein
MTSEPTIAALECRVGLGRLAVPTDAIEVLGEYEVGSRLPLTDRISYAIGVWQGEVTLSLSLARADRAAMRTTSGLVLAVPGTAIRWAFEIVAPIGLIELSGLARPQSTTTSWLRTATLAHGGAIQFVDVRMLIGELDALSQQRVAR